MIKSYKVRLEPNKQQEQKLLKSAGTARWAYNWTLAKQEENYKNGSKFINEGELRKELTQLKKKSEFKWLNNVSAQIPKQAIKDACNAYKLFFNKKRNKPKFKVKKKSKQAFYNREDKLNIHDSKVTIEKVGRVRLSEKDRIPKGVKYFNTRITHDGLHWYISVSVEEVKTLPQLTSESIGIDLGIKDLAICSNGNTYKNINKTNKIKKIKKQLRRLQRKVSKKYENNKKGGSYVKTSNIIKLEKETLKLHKRLKNIRTDYIHKITTEIVKTKPSRIVMEDLNIVGMLKNKHLSKAIQEQNLYEFYKQIKYKCEWNGIKLVTADRFFPSSKLCSKCGYVNKDLKLSDRIYVCPCCGNVIDRDYQSSINLSVYESV